MNPTYSYDARTLVALARNNGIQVDEKHRVVFAPMQYSRVRNQQWVGFRDKKKRSIVEALNKAGWITQSFIKTGSVTSDK